MNEKTAKLINRYSLKTGEPSRQLKRDWLSLNARERWQRRQQMLQELVGKKAKKK